MAIGSPVGLLLALTQGDGSVVVTPPDITPPPPDIQGGTTGKGGTRRHHADAAHPAFTKKEYYKLIEQWAREAAAKTAEIVDRKRVATTEKAVVAAAKNATAEESVRLQRIWAETAARIAEIEAIDSKYQKMADDLAAHFGRLAAELEDEDEVIALLLS